MNMSQPYGKAAVCYKEKEILRLCAGKKVMDVGCVGQDKFFQSPDWLHKKIKSVAASTVGVDVNMEWKSAFDEHGYTLWDARELDGVTERFELVVMGDVIEHVDNVSSFLETYARFLAPGGQMVISTPNPFSARQFYNIFLYGKPSVNPEHTVWLDPMVMTEVFKRLGYKIEYFCWLHEYGKPKGFRNRILYPMYRLYYSFRRFFSPNFLFVVSR